MIECLEQVIFSSDLRYPGRMEHGLRSDQAHILFEFASDGMNVYKFNYTKAGSFESLQIKNKKSVPEIEKLLNELKEYIID